MLLRLFALFTIVPLIELAGLVWLSGKISFPATLALIVGTGLARTGCCVSRRGRRCVGFRPIWRPGRAGQRIARRTVDDGRRRSADFPGLCYRPGGAGLVIPSHAQASAKPTWPADLRPGLCSWGRQGTGSQARGFQAAGRRVLPTIKSSKRGSFTRTRPKNHVKWPGVREFGPGDSGFRKAAQCHPKDGARHGIHRSVATSR